MLCHEFACDRISPIENPATIKSRQHTRDQRDSYTCVYLYATRSPKRDLKYKLGDGGFTRVLDLTAEAQNPLLHVDVVASSGPHEERRTRAG